MALKFHALTQPGNICQNSGSQAVHTAQPDTALQAGMLLDSLNTESHTVIKIQTQASIWTKDCCRI